jgi:hypothetical protein
LRRKSRSRGATGLPAFIAKMVYDWENKEDICYRMYIDEKKSLEEIMDFMKEEHKFAPR